MKMRFLTSLRFHVLWKSETMSTIGTYHITQTLNKYLQLMQALYPGFQACTSYVSVQTRPPSRGQEIEQYQ